MRVMPENLLTCSSMNTIIEDAETLKFFTGEGRWTSNATEGKKFPDTVQAFNAARHEPIGKFNIAGYIVETRQLINLRTGRGAGSPPTSPH
jgi:hypothetical protein